MTLTSCPSGKTAPGSERRGVNAGGKLVRTLEVLPKRWRIVGGQLDQRGKTTMTGLLRSKRCLIVVFVVVVVVAWLVGPSR